MGMVKATLENIEEAARIVKKGGLIVYPTDTVYGLGCSPFNVKAVERLIQVKGVRNKPLPILSCSLRDIEKIAEFSEKARRIGETFWPGPLTLVLTKKLIPDVVTSGLTTVGVRIPDHKVALELIRLCDRFLVGTSANKAGSQPPSTAVAAFEQLGDEVNTILDGGVAKLGISSTIIDLAGEEPKILRKGSICLDDILESLKRPA